MEVFSLEQSGLFLASANQGRDKNMNSALYRWEGNGFSFYQDLETLNAQDLEFFTIKNEVFKCFLVQLLYFMKTVVTFY